MKPKLILIPLLVSILALPSVVQAQAKKPNILVIWGDDIGWYNPSIYNRGDMGYWTPNIDRIGKEGAMFTCWYGQQSCFDAGFCGRRYHRMNTNNFRQANMSGTIFAHDEGKPGSSGCGTKVP